MRCSVCGTPLEGHVTDVGFQLPDVIWALPARERRRRAQGDADVQVLDGERFFIRGVAFLPVHGDEQLLFGWGLWAEVSADDYRRYRRLMHRDASQEPPAEGVLANTPVGYDDLGSQRVLLRFGPSTERPTLHLRASDHRLYHEQCDGIDVARLHELVELQPG